MCFTLSIFIAYANYRIKNVFISTNIELIKSVTSDSNFPKSSTADSVVNLKVNKPASLNLLTLKRYYQVVETVKQLDHSERLFNFRNSLNQANNIIFSGSFNLDLLLVGFSKSKLIKNKSYIQVLSYDNYSSLKALDNEIARTYYHSLVLKNLQQNNLNIKLNSIDDSLHSAEEDRWITKNTFVDRHLALNNNSYKLAITLIKELNTSSSLTNLNIWSSNFYSKNNINLNNLNYSYLNKNFFINLSNDSTSKEFFQKRSVYLIPNQNMSHSFFFKTNSNTTSSSDYLFENLVMLPIMSNNYIDFLSKKSLLNYNHVDSFDSKYLNKVNNFNTVWITRNLEQLYFTSTIKFNKTKYTNRNY